MSSDACHTSNNSSGFKIAASARGGGGVLSKKLGERERGGASLTIIASFGQSAGFFSLVFSASALNGGGLVRRRTGICDNKFVASQLDRYAFWGIEFVLSDF
jgi:hypothetical protein